jgi:fimbrial chaperone protein
VRVFGWSQEQNKDNLTPTQALSASPPMIEVAPQATQTIRLVRAAGPRSAREESFRVLIDEIVDRTEVSDNGVSVQLRYSVPVFMSTAGMKPPRMTVTPTLKNQTLTFKAQNGGGQHASVSAVTLENASGESVVIEPGLVGYVLVGQIMEWNLLVPATSTVKGPYVTLHCRFNGEAFSTKL